MKNHSITLLCVFVFTLVGCEKYEIPVSGAYADGGDVFKGEFPVATAVDLGLSVKWASHNMGAKNENEKGGTFCFQDNSGAGNNSFVKLGGNSTSYYSYASMEAFDIATKQWGEGWAVPTDDQWKELRDKCTVNVIDGNFVKVVGTNGNYIILPVADYWTCTNLGGDSYDCCYVSVNSYSIGSVSRQRFDYKERIRPVYTK